MQNGPVNSQGGMHYISANIRKLAGFYFIFTPAMRRMGVFFSPMGGGGTEDPA
jgi:hypothetical protein